VTSPEHERPVHGRSLVTDVVVVIGVFLVAGLVVGLVWPQLVEPVTVTRTDAGIGTAEVELANTFDHDAWYSLLGGVSGLVLGVVLTAWRRSHETVTLLVLVAGALLAAWLSSFIGAWVGPEPAAVALADAPVGATAPDEVRVTSDAAYLAWPVGAVLGAVVVLWSPPGDRLLSRGNR